MITRLAAGFLAGLLATGCVDRTDQKNFPIPIDGTMYRVGPYAPTAGKTQLNLEICVVTCFSKALN